MTAATVRFNQSFAAAFAAATAEIEYAIDSKGRKVRLPNAQRPVTPADTRDMMLYNRVLEEEEILEAVGKGVLDFLVKNGRIQRDSLLSTRYWITKAAQKAYDLPEYLGPRTFVF